MLKNLAQCLKTRSLAQCNSLCVSKVFLHSTADLHKSQSHCMQNKCAQTECKAKFKADEKFVSVWATPNDRQPEDLPLRNFPPECCKSCPYQPFDVMYYRPSDKCRYFQRTWWECVPRMVPKRICCGDAIPPEKSRRSPQRCPESACTISLEKASASCKAMNSDACQRLTMPCCRNARIPPSCVRARIHVPCKKRKCPFPSYSECEREELSVPHERPAECRCLSSVSMCDGIRMAIKIKAHNDRFCPCPTCKRI